MRATILKTWFIFTFLIPMIPGQLFAQSEQGPPSIKFSCVVWKQLPFPELYYRQGEEFLPVKMQLNQRSALYPMKGQTKFQLYVPHKSENGELPFKLVGQANLLPGTNRLLFLILTSPERARLPLRIIAIDDSLKALPPGSFRFVNFTTIPLSVTFNGKRNIIKSKASEVISTGVAKGGGFLPVTIFNSQGKELFGTRLYSQRKSRDMVFIMPRPKNSTQLRIKFLSQVVHPEPAKTP